MPLHEPVYALTEGLPAKSLAKAIHAAVEKVPAMPEWQDAAFRKARGWEAFDASLRAAHAPAHEADLSPETPVRQRLAYDELLANQLALLLIRAQMRGQKGRSLKGDGHLKAKAIAALPFALTDAQPQAIAEIEADMAAPSRMLRLLQGDVGAGKTIVAFLALLGAVEAGAQGALMAPTEILCAPAHGLARTAGESRRRAHGDPDRTRAQRPRDQTLAALANGEIDILVGTHALFSEDVAFADLGLAVVDEQHRFGVHQRMQLAGQGGRPADVLVMTATPIPRTLALTAYGDMDVSRLTGRPPGRKAGGHAPLSAERLDEVVEHLRRAIAKGARAYWVCPLVEESEKIDLAAAEERAAMLQARAGFQSRADAWPHEGTGARCRDGEVQIGRNLSPRRHDGDRGRRRRAREATIMVVEHAERFGLAQLHQLRGRVGRGAAKSSCLLVYHGPLGETAKARLKTMRETDDGFVIAEEDLRLRGAGELLGTRQSGMPEFRLADLAAHADLLAVARDDAQLVLTRDPDLQSERGEALRTLLYLFGRDEAVRYSAGRLNVPWRHGVAFP